MGSIQRKRGTIVREVRKNLCSELITIILANVGRDMSESGKRVCVYVYLPHGKCVYLL